MAKKKTMAKINRAIKKRRVAKDNRPFWKGPEEDGITQSLLGRFLNCRERFRVRTIEGLGVPERFSAPLEYGNMWHICEEHHASDDDWGKPLLEYARECARKYPLQQQDVEKWYQVCRLQFPIYVNYWKHNEHVKKRRHLFSEFAFRIPYELPSGRVVTLRGMWDSVDEVGRSIFLQENKTKGQVAEEQIKNRLLFDIQTGIYLVALRTHFLLSPKPAMAKRIRGVRYNVIRRPLSGGKGSIRPHKATKTKAAETLPEYYARLDGIIRAEPETYFMRWETGVVEDDVERFCNEFLNPVLESLWDWWEWMIADLDDPWRSESDSGRAANGIHWRHPYGVWNPMDNGRTDELDEYVVSGSKAGLDQNVPLFPELEGR